MSGRSHRREKPITAKGGCQYCVGVIKILDDKVLLSFPIVIPHSAEGIAGQAIRGAALAFVRIVWYIEGRRTGSNGKRDGGEGG